MRDLANEYSVRVLCRVLKVSSSGYYDWLKRVPRAEVQQLTKRVEQIHDDSHGTYGARRVRAELRAAGIHVSRKRVIKLMKAAGVRVKKRKRHQKTTDSNHPYPIAPNLLNRNFTAERANQCWVSDITCVKTGEGWLYLATFLDLYSRMIVGWGIAENQDSSIVLQAFQMGFTRRKVAPGMVHSDRGTQYASEEFRKQLSKHPNCQQSMSRRANCLDNAVAESFFGTLKTELGYRFPTRKEASLRIFEYIEVFYNRRRRHSHLDYVSPTEYESKTA